MRNLGLSALAAVALLLPACSSNNGTTGSGSGVGVGSSMFILTCSLGCPSGANGQELLCNGLTIAPNQEFVVTFSQLVDPNSVTAETFSIIAPGTGATPPGTRLVDPADHHRVIFRPSITFDALGNPTFGFSPGTSYSILIKGTSQDATGPYIRSTGGKPNSSRMWCPMSTGQEPADYVPGAPTVSVEVDVRKDPPDPVNPILFNQNADGATNVWNQSTVRLIFNDIMNPITLASQVTHQPTFSSVAVDVDGDLTTSTDRVVLNGPYIVTMDMVNVRTTMTFHSNSGMPSSGNPSLHAPRRIVVSYSAGIEDLSGLPIANPGSIAFVPEYPAPSPITLEEDFTSTVNEQADISSGVWGNSRLTGGIGGGSGRLGALTVRQGAAVDFSTDDQEFPLEPSLFPTAVTVRDLLDNAVPGGTYGGVVYVPGDPSTWPTVTVTDGVFEFSSLTILPGATLRFHGDHAARVLVRGPVDIQGNGTLDVRGASASAHLSDAADGGAGGEGGPNGGAGGDGGDRYDNSDAGLLSAGAISNPGAVYNGGDGGPVGQIAGLGVANGGLQFPPSNYPVTLEAPASVAGGLSWTFDHTDVQAGLVAHFGYEGCICLQAGRPGGGATYGDGTHVVGGPGIPNTPMPTDEWGVDNTPPNTLQGPGIPIEPADPESGHFVRTLDADLGFLRGGSGGGGGGLSMFGTQTSQDFPFSPGDCGGPGYQIRIPDPPAVANCYQDNSGCGGGGGGGAVQLVSGNSILLDGVVDARGGDGGSADATPAISRERQASPGGGGAGGAVRLQAPFVVLGAIAGRIIVAPGAGGVTDMNHLTDLTQVSNALGGSGTTGLVRIEDLTGSLTRSLEAPWIMPFDPNVPESNDFLSVGTWALPNARPETFTASTSCWMQPTESFFLLVFDPDDLGNADPAKRYGWNMDVIYDSGSGEQLIAYRGPDPLSPYYPNSDFETALGNTLNHGLPTGQGSPIAIRFQGAKSTASIVSHPCDVRLTGLTADISSGSLTPWVQHPNDLNAFNPHPDMVRFCVVFDASLVNPPAVGSFIKGVTNIRIRTTPD